jgi:signal peptidase I
MDDQIRINTRPAPVPANDGYKRPSSGGQKDLISTVAIIILAPLIALFLTAFIFQSYEVDGPSMEPTLDDNDRLIVNKTNRTWSMIFSSNYVPERYDIVVFNQNSSAPDGSEQKQLIKRVVGLPGDRVVIKDGKVTVYNQQNPEGFPVDEQGPHGNIVEYTDGHIEQTVEEGEIFVLGDNRKNSLDSRAFGAISSEDVVGTLSVRIYPFDSVQKF